MRLLILGLILPFVTAVQAPAANLIRGGDCEGGQRPAWVAGKNVALEPSTAKVHGGRKSLRVAWEDVGSFTEWAQKGNLFASSGRIISEPLKRDTRYRVRAWVYVDKLDVTPESRRWLAEYAPGMWDSPTVTIGCYGGSWDSGMPWAAYDISRPQTWQELSCEFTTPYKSGGEFALHADVYPYQSSQLCSSGLIYVDDVSLEECVPRIGFTRTTRPVTIDGKLDEWWETNPAVITCDQVVAGEPASNRSAAGIVYTAWDDANLYLAAKIVDDAYDAGRDGVAIWLNGARHVLGPDSLPADWQVAVKPDADVGSTANMYRIVSQFGDEVRGQGGYVVEAAIPIRELAVTPERASRFAIALEILDSDGGGPVRRLRFPCFRDAAAEELAEGVLADQRGELEGGEYPQFAVTDAGNPRARPRPLAVKNVAARVVRQGRLAYPAALYGRGDPGKVDAIVSWTTSAAASGFVEYGLGDDFSSRAEGDNGVGEASGIAMRAILRDLEPNRQYHYRVVARQTPESPAVRSETRVLDTHADVPAGVERGVVELKVVEPDGIPRTAWPVTSGVPFPQGDLASVKNLRLLDSGSTPVPAQFAPLAEWPDGSLRWVLVDFQTDLAAHGTANYRLAYGSQVEGEAPATPLKVDDGDRRIAVDTGAVSFVVDKKSFGLFDEVRAAGQMVAGPGSLQIVDADGRPYRAGPPDSVEIEELGPLRACIRVAGRYLGSDGRPWFGYEVRIHALAGKPFVRVTHDFTCRLKDESDDRMPQDPPEDVYLNSMSLDLTLAETSDEVSIGTGRASEQSFPLAAGSAVEMRQKHESEATVAGRTFERLPGWARLGETLVAVRDFWQLYPAAIRFSRAGRNSQVRVGLMPPIDAGDYPSAPDSIEDWVWGYLRRGRYRLRRGEGRTHELFLTFGVSAKDAARLARAQLAEPLVAQAEPQWYARTQAAGVFLPRDPRFAAYDKAFERGLEGLRKRRESEPFFDGRYGLYGLRNFGDNFGSDGMNWDNLEYDMTHACLVQFLRTGDLVVLKAARECHLHNREVDCLTIRPGFERLSHHTGDHNQKPAGLGHMWCEGAWEYYFLTGDRRSARKAIGISNDFARSAARLQAGGTPGAGGARDYGWSVVGLTAASRATADPLYLNAAREIEEVVVRTQDPFRGGWIHRLSTGHCFHAPAHSGRVYFMHDIVLDGQVLFHRLTADPDVEKCIVAACRGILDEVDQQRARGLPGLGYTSCPFLLFPGPWYPGREKHSFNAHENYAAIYYACSLEGGRDLAPRIFADWTKANEPWSGSFSDQGKMFVQATRWAPLAMDFIARLRGNEQETGKR